MMPIKTFFPEPHGLQFKDWGSVVAEQLSAYGVSAPIDEESWKTWVCALFEVPQLVSMNIPTADGFADWQSWAQQFIGSVR